MNCSEGRGGRYPGGGGGGLTGGGELLGRFEVKVDAEDGCSAEDE